MRPKTASKEI